MQEKISTNLHGSIHLGGKHPLSKSETGKLHNYYGSSIRRSVNSLEVMKIAVWAISFHKLSETNKPQYGLCTSDNSWCKFKSYSSSRVAYEHKHSLPPAVTDTNHYSRTWLVYILQYHYLIQGKSWMS